MLKYISDVRHSFQTKEFWLSFMVSDRSKRAAKEKTQHKRRKAANVEKMQ